MYPCLRSQASSSAASTSDGTDRSILKVWYVVIKTYTVSIQKKEDRKKGTHIELVYSVDISKLVSSVMYMHGKYAVRFSFKLFFPLTYIE